MSRINTLAFLESSTKLAQVGFHEAELDSTHTKKLSKEECQRRAKCRRETREAIRAGALVKQPCEACGSAGVEAHHDDYGKPFEVRWLCFKHHCEVHNKRTIDLSRREAGTSIPLSIRAVVDSEIMAGIKPYSEIARQYGVSRERIRQIAALIGAPPRNKVYKRQAGRFAPNSATPLPATEKGAQLRGAV